MTKDELAILQKAICTPQEDYGAGKQARLEMRLTHEFLAAIRVMGGTPWLRHIAAEAMKKEIRKFERGTK